MIVTDGLTPVGVWPVFLRQFLSSNLLSDAFSMFVTGTDGEYLKFAHNLVPGRVVISKFVGNGILFYDARNSADDL